MKQNSILSPRFKSGPGEAVLNCIAGERRKTRKGNHVIPLVDICGQEYGKVILEDDFDVDLDAVVNVSFQTILGKPSNYQELEGRLSAIRKSIDEFLFEVQTAIALMRDDVDNQYYEKNIAQLNRAFLHYKRELAVLLKEGEQP